ncbi:7654_t:CDS:1 [Ambispora gerdemannii]|uniref:7654_t:CDS:1 n=1 Tax=Ambispora gerdemannii TaxID=144530 RepID=A0A9N9BA42_9GLOM|nr:7654_t:CDS:1 [Ambispora gerdemannii]
MANPNFYNTVDVDFNPFNPFHHPILILSTINREEEIKVCKHELPLEMLQEKELIAQGKDISRKQVNSSLLYRWICERSKKKKRGDWFCNIQNCILNTKSMSPVLAKTWPKLPEPFKNIFRELYENLKIERSRPQEKFIFIFDEQSLHNSPSITAATNTNNNHGDFAPSNLNGLQLGPHLLNGQYNIIDNYSNIATMYTNQNHSNLSSHLDGMPSNLNDLQLASNLQNNNWTSYDDCSIHEDGAPSNLDWIIDAYNNHGYLLNNSDGALSNLDESPSTLVDPQLAISLQNSNRISYDNSSNITDYNNHGDSLIAPGAPSI